MGPDTNASIQGMLSTRDVILPTNDRRLHRCSSLSLMMCITVVRSFVHDESATKETGGALVCRESDGECIKAAGYRAL